MFLFSRLIPTSPEAAGRLLLPEILPDQRELVLRVMPLPSDVNANGDIFGGWIMAQVDLAGAVLPSRIAKGRIATVAVNQFIFKQPVSVGDLLSFYARVTRIGTDAIALGLGIAVPGALALGLAASKRAGVRASQRAPR